MHARALNAYFAPGLITVSRSWDRDTTKGGHADAIPIAREMEPFLQVAIDASPSDLVFRGPDGRRMRRESAKLQHVLRRALPQPPEPAHVSRERS